MRTPNHLKRYFLPSAVTAAGILVAACTSSHDKQTHSSAPPTSTTSHKVVCIAHNVTTPSELKKGIVHIGNVTTPNGREYASFNISWGDGSGEIPAYLGQAAHIYSHSSGIERGNPITVTVAVEGKPEPCDPHFVVETYQNRAPTVTTQG